MNMPPLVMRMQINNTQKNFRLWLPLFIIFPLAGIITLALFIVALPFLLLAAIFQWRLWRTIIFFWPCLIGLLTALRELEIDVQDNSQRIHVSFK